MKIVILMVLLFAAWLVHCQANNKIETRKLKYKNRNQNQNRWITKNTNTTYKITLNRALRVHIIKRVKNKRKLTTRYKRNRQHRGTKSTYHKKKINRNGNKMKLTLSQKRARKNRRANKTNTPKRNNNKESNNNYNNKTKTTMTPSEKIREYYNEARWIQKPMLYGFSTTEADKFVSRFDENLVIPTVTPQCTNQKAKISKKDIGDLCRILRTSQCKAGTNKTNTTTTAAKSRKRRSTSQTIMNADGSITRIRRCVTRGAVTSKGYIRLCSQCHAVTELPNQMYVFTLYPCKHTTLLF